MFLEVPFCIIIPCQHRGTIIMERISAKDHGDPKCPSVLPFEILRSEGPFEVGIFEHFCLERPFNMAVMIFFTSKCPSESDISRLEHNGQHRTVYLLVRSTFTDQPIQMRNQCDMVLKHKLLTSYTFLFHHT